MKQPKSWSDITIRKYIERVKLSRKENTDQLTTVDQLIKLAALTFECSEDEAAEIPLNVLNEVNALFQSEKPTVLIPKVKIDGIYYEFELDPTKLTAGQYAGVMTAAKDLDLNLHILLFHLAKPFKYGWFKKRFIKFDDSQTIEVLERFKDIPMSMANPVCVFFFKLSKELMQILEIYSDHQLTKMNKTLSEVLTDLEKDTDGIKQ